VSYDLNSIRTIWPNSPIKKLSRHNILWLNHIMSILKTYSNVLGDITKLQCRLVAHAVCWWLWEKECSK
jgi:hypothetical protein